MVKKKVKLEPKARTTMSLLLENSIALQKTLTELAAELKNLNKKVSSLYDLFEEASKSFKEAETAPEIQELLDKVNGLVEQNKTIARGLLLLERTFRGKEEKTEKFRKIIKARARKEPEELEEEAGEEAEEVEETEEEEGEYKPKPLPEFSF